MTETLVSRSWTCPTCDREYTRIARHWGTTCPYPEIDDDLRAVCNGLALGGASADGSDMTRLRLWTTNETLALWTYRELGWLASSVRVRPADEHSLGERDRYVVSTLTHPDCERYRRWGPAVVDRVAWSSRLGRVWFAHAGSLAHRDTGRPTVVFRIADDDYRAALASFLERAGFENAVGSETVTLSQSVTARFLEELGEPVPGAEHKWATDRRVYDHCLHEHPLAVTDDRATRYRTLLSVVAETTRNAELSRETFNSAFAAPSAATVADYLGGGSWDDAKHVAGVYETAKISRESASPVTNHPSTYGGRACRHALRRVATHLDTGSLSIRAYDGARFDAEPSSATVLVTLSENDRWTEAVAVVGLTTGHSDHDGHRGPRRTYSDGDCEHALAAAGSATDGNLTKVAYWEWVDTQPQDADLPSPSTIANLIGDGSWAVAVESVGHTPGESGRIHRK